MHAARSCGPRSTVLFLSIRCSVRHLSAMMARFADEGQNYRW